MLYSIFAPLRAHKMCDLAEFFVARRRGGDGVAVVTSGGVSDGNKQLTGRYENASDRVPSVRARSNNKRAWQINGTRRVARARHRVRRFSLSWRRHFVTAVTAAAAVARFQYTNKTCFVLRLMRSFEPMKVWKHFQTLLWRLIVFGTISDGTLLQTWCSSLF